MTIIDIVTRGLLWHLCDRKTSFKEIAHDEKNINGVQCNDSTTHKGSSNESFVKSIKYVQKPDMKEIFGTIAKRWGNVDIRVIVCGPPTLLTCVAKECRYGDEQKLAGFLATLQAIISFVEDG
ncbi:ferric reduction oxidase 7, chloroplastic-like protein [Tanacetum coccineum]